MGTARRLLRPLVAAGVCARHSFGPASTPVATASPLRTVNLRGLTADFLNIEVG